MGDSHLPTDDTRLESMNLTDVWSERDILVEAQTLGHTGAWAWHVPTGRLWWSDEMCRIFGLSPQEFPATYKAFLERVHPDDRREVEQRVHEALAVNGHYDAHHRVIRPDGELRHVRERACVTQDADGAPVRMLGFVQDITDEHTLRQALADSEERYRLLAENAWDVIWTMEMDGSISYVSPAVERMRGITPEEAMTQTLDQINPPESAQRVMEYYGRLYAAIEAGTEPPTFHGEQEYYRKDGSIMLGELYVIPQVYSDGRVVRILGVTRDISERRMYEDELNRLAITDPLTGVWNRRQGELIGRLGTHLRASDVLARWGGEEFVILVRHCTLAEVLPIAEKLRALAADTPFAEVGTVTVSIGAAELQPDDDFATWLDRADQAMYDAKATGRNAVRARS